MIAHTTGDITAGSPLGLKVVEHNPERHIRPIILKIRKVKGKTGWFLRRIGWWFGAPLPSDVQGLGHHALSIGPYAYEMTREVTMIGQRLTVDEIWPSTVGEVFVGYTDFTDVEIQITCKCTPVTQPRKSSPMTDFGVLVAVKVEAWMKSRNGGKYNLRTNNCQHFVQELLRRVLVPSDLTNSETSSLKSTSTACKSTTTTTTTVTCLPVSEKTVSSTIELQVPGKTQVAVVTTYALPVNC